MLKCFFSSPLLEKSEYFITEALSELKQDYIMGGGQIQKKIDNEFS